MDFTTIFLLAFAVSIQGTAIPKIDGVPWPITTTTNAPGPGPNPNPNPDPQDAVDLANNIALQYINDRRRAHKGGTNTLEYDANLKNTAQDCASGYDNPIKTPVESHKDYDRHCMAVGTDTNEVIFTVAAHESKNPNALSGEFVLLYKNGLDAYKFSSPTVKMSEENQVFTQMLWLGSKKMGCACDENPLSDGRFICSCLFSPAGNIRIGDSNAGVKATYSKNVLSIQ